MIKKKWGAGVALLCTIIATAYAVKTYYKKEDSPISSLNSNIVGNTSIAGNNSNISIEQNQGVSEKTFSAFVKSHSVEIDILDKEVQSYRQGVIALSKLTETMNEVLYSKEATLDYLKSKEERPLVKKFIEENGADLTHQQLKDFATIAVFQKQVPVEIANQIENIFQDKLSASTRLNRYINSKPEQKKSMLRVVINALKIPDKNKKAYLEALKKVDEKSLNNLYKNIFDFSQKVGIESMFDTIDAIKFLLLINEETSFDKQRAIFDSISNDNSKQSISRIRENKCKAKIKEDKKMMIENKDKHIKKTFHSCMSFATKTSDASCLNDYPFETIMKAKELVLSAESMEQEEKEYWLNILPKPSKSKGISDSNRDSDAMKFSQVSRLLIILKKEATQLELLAQRPKHGPKWLPCSAY